MFPNGLQREAMQTDTVETLFKRPQTCKCKKGTDWLKRWVEAQHNIFKL